MIQFYKFLFCRVNYITITTKNNLKLCAVYHKVIDCHVFDSFGVMSVSFDAAPKPNIWLIDENGFKFFSKGLVHMRFARPVPEWYLKLANIGIEVSKPCKIGNYVRLYDEESEKND